MDEMDGMDGMDMCALGTGAISRSGLRHAVAAVYREMAAYPRSPVGALSERVQARFFACMGIRSSVGVAAARKTEPVPRVPVGFFSGRVHALSCCGRSGRSGRVSAGGQAPFPARGWGKWSPLCIGKWLPVPVPVAAFSGRVQARFFACMGCRSSVGVAAARKTEPVPRVPGTSGRFWETRGARQRGASELRWKMGNDAARLASLGTKHTCRAVGLHRADARCCACRRHGPYPHHPSCGGGRCCLLVQCPVRPKQESHQP